MTTIVCAQLASHTCSRNHYSTSTINIWWNASNNFLAPDNLRASGLPLTIKGGWILEREVSASGYPPSARLSYPRLSLHFISPSRHNLGSLLYQATRKPTQAEPSQPELRHVNQGQATVRQRLPSYTHLLLLALLCPVGNPCSESIVS